MKKFPIEFEIFFEEFLREIQYLRLCRSRLRDRECLDLDSELLAELFDSIDFLSVL